MRVLAAAALVAATASACGGVFQQYEYEEDVYLSLDGSATVYVNSSIAALDALRGASLDTSVIAPVDRAAVSRLFSSPVTHVVRVNQSRRRGRRFVHLRVEVDDVNRMSEAPAFAWSSYGFSHGDRTDAYRQSLGPSMNRPVGEPGWTGNELVAFRLHIPSKITFHNAGEPNFRRGNILVWEQTLRDRLQGVPLTIEARMETQSILYRTLWLFGATILAVVFTFGAVILWVLRRGRASQPSESRI